MRPIVRPVIRPVVRPVLRPVFRQNIIHRPPINYRPIVNVVNREYLSYPGYTEANFPYTSDVRHVNPSYDNNSGTYVDGCYDSNGAYHQNDGQYFIPDPNNTFMAQNDDGTSSLQYYCYASQ